MDMYRWQIAEHEQHVYKRTCDKTLLLSVCTVQAFMLWHFTDPFTSCTTSDPALVPCDVHGSLLYSSCPTHSNSKQTMVLRCLWQGGRADLRLQVANHEACNDLLWGEMGEGHLAGEHLPEHHAQAPHISLLAHTLRVRHQLWSHVRKCAPAHHTDT